MNDVASPSSPVPPENCRYAMKRLVRSSLADALWLAPSIRSTFIKLPVLLYLSEMRSAVRGRSACEASAVEVCGRDHPARGGNLEVAGVTKTMRTRIERVHATLVAFYPRIVEIPLQPIPDVLRLV